MTNEEILNKAKALIKKNTIIYFDLETEGYGKAFDLQQDLFNLVMDKECLGFLLMMEHYPVITIGSNRNLENLISDKKVLAEKRIELIQSTRGGDITFHGPGQLVGYPILNLALLKKDVSLYVYNLEQILIGALNHFDIQGRRIKGHRGVFVDNQKIASVGIKIKRWVTMHGFALNVSTELEHFKHIIACGLEQYPPTSMEKILNNKIPLNYVKEQILTEFGKVFEQVTRS